MAIRSAYRNLKVVPGLLCARAVGGFLAAAAVIYGLFPASPDHHQTVVDDSQYSVATVRPGETIPFRRHDTMSSPATLEGIWSTVLAALRQSYRPDPGAVRKMDLLHLSASLREESLHLKFRRGAAWELAKICDNESIAILEEARTNASSYLKSGIAESLGQCPHPRAAKMIVSFLGDDDEIVARGAIRALAAIGDTESVSILGRLLLDDGRSQAVRYEAALALGEAGTWEAYDVLMDAFTRAEDEEFSEGIIAGLGKMEFERTEWFFREYLTSPHVTAEQRVAAIEALGNASGNTAPFLLELLRDEDPQVRAASAWSLGMAEISDRVRQTMAGLLRLEKDPEVRLRITQAIDSPGPKIQ